MATADPDRCQSSHFRSRRSLRSAREGADMARRAHQCGRIWGPPVPQPAAPVAHLPGRGPQASAGRVDQDQVLLPAHQPAPGLLVRQRLTPAALRAARHGRLRASVKSATSRTAPDSHAARRRPFDGTAETHPTQSPDTRTGHLSNSPKSMPELCSRTPVSRALAPSCSQNLDIHCWPMPRNVGMGSPS